jgi:hypothetical protein
MEGIQGIEFGENQATWIHKMKSGKKNLRFQQNSRPRSLIMLLICKLW